MKQRRKRRARLWSFAAGDRGHTVAVFERERDGPLYARAFDPSLRNGRGDYRRVSLGHRDKERAKVYALAQAAKLREGRAEIVSGKTTLGRLFALYQTHRTPRKSRGERIEDDRRIKMWTRHLGANKDPHRITLGGGSGSLMLGDQAGSSRMELQWLKGRLVQWDPAPWKPTVSGCAGCSIGARSGGTVRVGICCGKTPSEGSLYRLRRTRNDP